MLSSCSCPRLKLAWVDLLRVLDLKAELLHAAVHEGSYGAACQGQVAC